MANNPKQSLHVNGFSWQVLTTILGIRENGKDLDPENPDPFTYPLVFS